MNIKFALSVFATAVLLASGTVDAQRGGGGGGGGHGGGGMSSGGGGMSGGGWSGGGSRGNWSGGGGSWNGGGGSWHGGGSWNGNKNWNGNGSWNRGWYGNRGWGWNTGWGCRGWCGAWGWNTGWWGGAWWGGPWWPGFTVAVGAPVVWANTWPVSTQFTTGSFSSMDSDQVFMEQDPMPQSAPSRQPAQQAHWYYCTEPAGYYPYVQACSKAWIPVVPQSVAPTRTSPGSL